MINIEIKARCSEHNRIRELLTSAGADFRGTDRQIDTYFKTNTGRLKLREGTIENNLIRYERENTSSPKQSDFSLYKSENPALLKDMLSKSLGVLTVVDKQREIFFINNVKFHLDRVNNLGEFIEIEATDSGGTIDKDKLLEQCKYYMQMLGIKESDLIPLSYSDMLINKFTTR